eukprot:scaffold48544_cov63-Phaeocystis_antarctica.AAC.4
MSELPLAKYAGTLPKLYKCASNDYRHPSIKYEGLKRCLDDPEPGEGMLRQVDPKYPMPAFHIERGRSGAGGSGGV